MSSQTAPFQDIAAAISADAPCGPDPDSDDEIQGFLSIAEGQLPASYRSFDRKAFAPNAVLDRLKELLAKSHDLRYVVLWAKFSILSDNLAGFADAVVAAKDLLNGQWDHCHPTEPVGGNTLRAAHLATLDDLPTVVLPLQNTPIVTDKRLGAISTRSILVASKKVPAQAGETVGDLDAIMGALQRYEPFEDLQTFNRQIETIRQTLKDLRQLFIDKVDYDTAPSFERLPQLLDFISSNVGKIVAERGAQVTAMGDLPPADGIEAGADTGPAAPAASTSEDLASVAEATNALDAVLAYYSGVEPSSPARLMVKQAKQLVGKSFVEALQVLAPLAAPEARVRMGADSPFALDFTQLSALVAGEERVTADAAEARSFSVVSRSESVTLCLRIEKFFRRTEPSSPIPLLLEKARGFASKDFASLLREVVKTEVEI